MQFGSWRLIKRLGAGGNGVVWQAEHNDGSLGAIKFLKNWNETPYQRFKDEDRIMRSCKGIQGVLPLLDSHLPARPSSNDRPWIVTALAEQINRKNKLATLENVVRLCESLAETLAEMHERGCSHRDIKPENILFFNGRYCLCDFGLADAPKKAEVTAEGKKLGPMQPQAMFCA